MEFTPPKTGAASEDSHPPADAAPPPAVSRRPGPRPAVAPRPRRERAHVDRHRPPAPQTLRLIHAYWVTFVTIGSYLSVKLQARFRSPGAIERLLERKHRANARRIEQAIIRLQGLFIKVGQLISIMTNFLPEALRSQLEGLQDQVPPRPYADIEQRFREEFGGRGPKQVFADFDQQPIASASIGQVHIARLESGEKVAVKVQYPDIERMVAIDLRTLRRIVGIVSWFVPYRGLDQIYREIREMVLQELDFRAEADHVERIAANFQGRNDVSFPRVFRDLSTSRVLTTAFVDGIKVNDLARLDAAGIDRSALARLVVQSYCQQIFTDGVYHADPHPGNILVQPGPAIVFIDFGAVAEVSPGMRRGIIDLLQGAINRDTSKIVTAMREMGFISRDADPQVFDRVIEYFHQRFQDEIQLESLNLKDVKFDPEKGLENLADLRKMNISLRDLTEAFHVPKEWILLERTILLLMGLCTELDPQMNPMTVIRPYLEEFVLGKERDWSALVLDTTKDIALSVLALPAEIKKLTARMMRGELEVHFLGVDESARLLYGLGHQVIYTMVGITAAVFWLVLRGRGEADAAHTASMVAAACGVLVLGSFFATRNRLRKRRRRY